MHVVFEPHAARAADGSSSRGPTSGFVEIGALMRRNHREPATSQLTQRQAEPQRTRKTARPLICARHRLPLFHHNTTFKYLSSWSFPLVPAAPFARNRKEVSMLVYVAEYSCPARTRRKCSVAAVVAARSAMAGGRKLTVIVDPGGSAG